LAASDAGRPGRSRGDILAMAAERGAEPPVGLPRAGVMVLDRELRVVAWSDALGLTTGVTTEQAIGRHCWEVLRAVDERGQAVCGQHCSLAHLALTDRPVPTIDVSVPQPGSPTLSMATLSARTRRGPLFLHVLSPRDPRPAVALSPALTARQREALTLLASGHSTEEIAAALGVAVVTARNHVTACLRRLDCHSRVEAVVKARRLGLVP